MNNTLPIFKNRLCIFDITSSILNNTSSIFNNTLHIFQNDVIGFHDSQEKADKGNVSCFLCVIASGSEAI